MSAEFRRYLDISLGSLSELSYLLLFSRDRGLLPTSEWEWLDAHRNRAGQLLWRLYRWVHSHVEDFLVPSFPRSLNLVAKTSSAHPGRADVDDRHFALRSSRCS